VVDAKSREVEAGFAAGAFLADHGWAAVAAAEGEALSVAGGAAGNSAARFGDGFKIAICARVHKRLLCYLLR